MPSTSNHIQNAWTWKAMSHPAAAQVYSPLLKKYQWVSGIVGDEFVWSDNEEEAILIGPASQKALQHSVEHRSGQGSFVSFYAGVTSK